MEPQHSEILINMIIGDAWDDDVSFDNIKKQTGLSEADVIKIMRRNLKPSSFKLWRKRVSGRKTKHEKRAIGSLMDFVDMDIKFVDLIPKRLSTL
jgi:uncharacterized protein (TIGR03643 family)